MSHDGCEEVKWKGQAFPFLMHHPNSFLKTENYGSARAAQQQSGGHSSSSHASAPMPNSDTLVPAGTGTWNGPAPKGYIRNGVNTAAPPAHAYASTKQPESLRLSSGATIPMIGLGTAGVKSAEPIKHALEAGYRHIDCASGYNNQQIIGEALKPFIESGRRSELFMTSKLWVNERRPQLVSLVVPFGYGNCGMQHVCEGQHEKANNWLCCALPDNFMVRSAALQSNHHMGANVGMLAAADALVAPACEKTISDLGVGYLDLLLMHWPEAQVPEAAATDDFKNNMTIDTSVTVLDTWREMEKLVDAGLVKAIGVSNFTVKEVEELLASARIKPAVNQVELHPGLPQRKLVGVCFRKGVQCVAYSPLGGANYTATNTLLNHPIVAAVAQEAGKTPAQVLLRWNMQRGVPVIPKASSPEHIKENIEGAFDWALTPEQKNKLDALENGQRVVSPGWKVWASPEEGGAAKPSMVIA